MEIKENCASVVARYGIGTAAARREWDLEKRKKVAARCVAIGGGECKGEK